MRKGALILALIGSFVLGGAVGAVLLLKVSSFPERVGELEARVSALQSEVEGLKGQLSPRVQDLEARLAQVEKEIKGLSDLTTTQFDKLGTRINELSREIDALEERVTQLQGETASLAELKGGLTALQGEVDGLKARLADQIESVSAQVVELRQEVEGIQGKLDGHEGNLAMLREELAELKTQLSQLSTAPPKLRIGYVDADGLFLKVFIPQVQEERAVMEGKKNAIKELNARRLRGEVEEAEYKKQLYVLQVELLKAQYGVDMAMLEKMIASPGFSDLRGDLESLREQAEPAVGEVEKLLQEANFGVVDEQTFLAKYQALQNAFQQLDQLLTQIAAQKIVEVTQAVAQEKGYDLVLRRKDVVAHNIGVIDDLTPVVERKLLCLLSNSDC